MDGDVFSLLVATLGLLILSAYNTATGKKWTKGGDDANLVLTIISSIVLTACLLYFLVALLDDRNINIRQPSISLFICAIIILALTPYYVIHQKKRNRKYSRFGLIFSSAYAAAVVAWGLYSFISD